METAFYHVTRGEPEAVLPRLLARVLGAGHRVAVRADAERLARLDQLLWTHEPASFLPHGRDGPDGARQPILLTGTDPPVNGADVLVALAPPLPEGGFSRVLYLFDDPAPARPLWREAKARGQATYWRQTETGWEQAG